MKRKSTTVFLILCSLAVLINWLGIGYRPSSSAVLDLKAELDALYGEEYTGKEVEDGTENMVFVVEPKTFFLTNWNVRNFLSKDYEYECKVVFTTYFEDGTSSKVREITYQGFDPMGRENSDRRAYLKPLYDADELSAMEGEEALVTWLATLRTAEISCTNDNVSIETIVEALNEAPVRTTVVQTPFGLTQDALWNLTLYVDFDGSANKSENNAINLYAGLIENVVEISCGESLPQGCIWLEDETLYRIVRYSKDDEEIIDEDALAVFEPILRKQMETHIASMSENLGNYIGYELTHFNCVWHYENPDGSVVELYDFKYALLPETIESVVLAGGMYFDSQLRIRGGNHGGPLAVRYYDDRITAFAFMENDFIYSPGDTENEAWAKEMINHALSMSVS